MKSFDDFNIEQCVLELRYSPAYLLWDRVGSIWSGMLAENPSLKASGIQATQQVFESDSIQISLDTSFLRFVSRGPTAIDEIVKNASWMTRFVCDKIKINLFTRAGFRIIRLKAFDTPAQAFEFAQVGTEGLASLGQKTRRVACVKSARYESDIAGIQATMKIEEREIAFKVPWDSIPYLPSDSARKDWVLVFDSDYYTVGIVERDSLDIETWVRQASKFIQTHWSSFEPCNNQN